MSSSHPTTDGTKTLRILMLHGFTQSGPLFYSKTRALHKALQRAFPAHSLHLSYPTAPHLLRPADQPSAPHSIVTSYTPPPPAEEAYGWWRRKDVTDGDGGKVLYEGLEEGMATIAQTIREEGPFDGVVGFSQGACAAALVASLLEGEFRVQAFETAQKASGGMPFPPSFLAKPQEAGGELKIIQPPLKFAIIYSGFLAPGPLYCAFYSPKIKTHLLHFLGQVDTVVDEERSQLLISSCEEEKVVVHPGGHFLPSQRPWLDAVVGFVKECIGESVKGNEKKEESVEDMDVPF